MNIGLFYTIFYVKKGHSLENSKYSSQYGSYCRFRWSRGLRRVITTAHLLELWVRISPHARMSVSFDCCVFSGRGFCVGLITRPEESYRVCVCVCVCVCVFMKCDRESSIMKRPWPWPWPSPGCFAVKNESQL
jgi:hypothetical protein